MNKLYKYLNGKRIRVLEDKRCFTCGNLFTPKTSKNKYCSRECYYDMKVQRGDKVNWTLSMRKKMSKLYKGKGNPMFGKSSWNKGKTRPEMTGKNHPNWKGGFSINKDGYKVIENNIETNGKKLLDHRRVMENYLGRKLLSTEIIHHKNHNKLDNRIENLMIVSRSEHMKIHPPLAHNEIIY